MATLKEAKILAAALEILAYPHGFHVGVGGGTVNKTGSRKDIDILIYSRRDKKFFGGRSTYSELLKTIKNSDIKLKIITDLNDGYDERWCTKASWWHEDQDIPVDLLFPESPAGEYSGAVEETSFEGIEV